MHIVIASSNRGKVSELQTLFAPLGFKLRPQSDYDMTDCEETGLTFIENAIIKARHATEKSGLPALADDSGLVIPALEGEPGIYSARYAGVPSNSDANIEKVLSKLQGHQARFAYFYCVLVLMQHSNDPVPLIAEGKWEGEIAASKAGENGFGYDPIFYLPERGATAAQLNEAEKNTISHRARAFKRLKQQLETLL